MDMQDIRKKYPMYDDVSDEDLLRGLHKKYYSDMEYDEFASRVEAKEPEKEVPRYLYNEDGTVKGINPEAAPTKDEARKAIQGGLAKFQEGQLLGWGDEIVGGLRAAAEYALEDTGDKSYGDLYRMYRDDQRRAADEFTEENPKTALGLTLGGGALSPANVVGPYAQAGKGVNALTAAAQTGGRGVVEGAIAGAGAAEDDTLEGATKGGILGGLVGGTLGGLGRAVSSRKIAQDIGKGEGQIPLHMIDAETPAEEAIASTYRNVLGRVPGTTGVLRRQEEAVVDAAEKLTDRTLKNVRTRKEVLQHGKEVFTSNVDKSLRRSVKQLDDDLAASQAAMRSEQAGRALPNYAPDEMRQALQAEPDPRKVSEVLDKFWGKDGPAFRSVKDETFVVDKPLARLLQRRGHIEEMDDLLGEELPGHLLMRWRNRPAMDANAAGVSGKAAFHKFKNREKTKGYDKQIRRLLKEKYGKNGADQFNADVDTYGEYKAYVKAVDAAEDLDGNFTGTQLGKTSKGDKRRRAGKAPGQKLAVPVRRLEKSLSASKKSLREAAKDKKSDPARKDLYRGKMDSLNDAAKRARENLKDVRGKTVAQNVTFPSQLATTTALAVATPFAGPAAIGGVLGGSRLAASKAGQRAVAGQTGWQKALQEDENMKLIAQILRQTAARQVAAEGAE